MVTKKGIDEELKKVLKEVGGITPIFDEKIGEWVFPSPLYPVEYGGTSQDEGTQWQKKEAGRPSDAKNKLL